MTGTLEPGGHSLAGSVAVGPNLNSIFATSATANYNFSLSLTPAPPSHRWKDPISGLFGVSNNWDDSIVPGTTDAATFDVPGTYTVQLDQDTTNKRLCAHGNGLNLTFDLNGSEYVADTIRVGGRPDDNVTVTFDDSNPPVAVVAAATAPGGAAAATSPVKRLRHRLLEAGKGGKADVKIPIETMFGQINYGGKVDVRTTKGHWECGGLTVGIDALGVLDVFNGGQLVTNDTLLAAGFSTIFRGDANVKVRGQGTLWDSRRQLIVGDSGDAILTIEDKAKLTSGENLLSFGNGLEDIVLGSQPGSTGTIQVSDASLILDPGDMVIGREGFGTLEVKNGAEVDVGDLIMGHSSTGGGKVKVESSGVLRIDGRMEIGKVGTGRLTIDGGSVEQASSGLGFNEIGPNGLVEVLDGHFHDHQTLVVNGELAIDRVNGSASLGFTPIQTRRHAYRWIGRFTPRQRNNSLRHGYNSWQSECNWHWLQSVSRPAVAGHLTRHAHNRCRLRTAWRRTGD